MLIALIGFSDERLLNMSDSWWKALALVLLIEGLLPLLIPKQWQQVLKTLSKQTPEQFRRIGGGLVVSALVILYWQSS